LLPGVVMVPGCCSPPAMTEPTDFSSRGFGDHARPLTEVENLMRSLPRILLVSLSALAVAAPASVSGQRTDDQIVPKSVELQQRGKALISAGKLDDAEDLLETSLAIDPRNRWAFVDLARVAEKQRLFGKAIRMTNKALMLEPNDTDALAVQGEAMVEMGAVARAQINLQKLQTICTKGCPQVAQLSAAITRGPTVASAKPPASPKSN